MDRCEKCGCLTIKTKYIPTTGIGDHGYVLREYLLKSCTRCSFSWKEPTLDNKEAPA